LDCKSCGTSNDDNATFCSSCGFNLHLSASPPSAPPSPPLEATTVPVLAVFRNAIALIVSPADFMTKNKGVVVPLRSVIINYMALLAAIPFIATVVGDVTFFGGTPSIIGFAVVYGLEVYVLNVVASIIMGAVIWKLAPLFGPKTDQAKATLLAVYVATPFFLLSIVDVIPYVVDLSYLGLLYGLYILYKGLPILLGTRSNRVLIFLFVIFVASIAVLGIITAIQYAIAVGLASLLAP
jgi:hypothetical protein